MQFGNIERLNVLLLFLSLKFENSLGWWGETDKWKTSY